MKTISAFFTPAFFVPVFFLAFPIVGQGLHFATPPSVRHFSDGALEWSASVSCADPALLLGAHVAFFLDTNLAGGGEGGAAGGQTGPVALSPADCEGDSLPLHRGFLPATPAVLRAELYTARTGNSGGPDSLTDVHSLLTGGMGSLLSLRRFCASPKNGEPEWIEVRNVSSVPISLGKVKLEGRALSGNLGAGESLTAIARADTAELRLWQPGARAFPLSSWPGLRNTGDTLRLTFEVKTLEGPARDGSATSLMLDSVAYGAGISVGVGVSEGAGGGSREACASVPTETSGAAAHGFGLDLPPGRWRRRAGPWVVTVSAPADSLSAGRYDLRVYDLDGAERCVLARNALGPQAFSLSTQSCGGLPASATAALLLLRPRGAPSVRRLLWISP